MSKAMPYAAILIAAALLCLIMAGYALRRSRSRAAGGFVALALCTAVYAFGYAGELMSGRLAAMLVWNKVQYLGISFIPACWLIFVARYSGRDGWLTRPVLAALFSLSSLTLVMDWTNGAHGLFYSATAVDGSGPFPVIVLTKGVFYFIHQIYNCLAFLAGAALLMSLLHRSPTAYRARARLVFVGCMMPWVGFLVYSAGLMPRDIDVTPFAFAAVSPLLAVGLIRLGIFDVIPMARESALASLEEGVLILDLGDRVVDFNPAATRLVPDVSREAVGLGLVETVPALQPLLAGPRPGARVRELDFEIEVPDGRRHLRAKLSPVVDRRSHVIGRLIVLSDTTEQARLIRMLQEEATTDPLTGDANRRHFLVLAGRELARARRSGRPPALLMIDLDDFKAVNDTWGHDVGDRVLRTVSRTIASGLRRSDLLARLGGDEFAVLLPEMTEPEAALVADRLRGRIAAAPIAMPGGEEIRVSVSIGIAIGGPEASGRVEDLLRAADRAMYQAKPRREAAEA